VSKRHVRIALIAPERFDLRLPRDPFEDWTEVPTEDLHSPLEQGSSRGAQPWGSNAAD